MGHRLSPKKNPKSQKQGPKVWTDPVSAAHATRLPRLDPIKTCIPPETQILAQKTALQALRLVSMPQNEMNRQSDVASSGEVDADVSGPHTAQ